METPSPIRLRRLRSSPKIRAIVRETTLDPSRFLYPVFVRDGERVKEPIPSLPRVERISIDVLVGEIASMAEELGIAGLLLFGIPSKKDELGSEAYSRDGTVQRAVRALHENGYKGVIATDVCLCQYTSHGHCGVVRDGRVLNDETLDHLSRIALSHAEAGADVVAPSAMMDHQVSAIRRALDEEGFEETVIMSYSAKFASSLYGPFRNAAHSAPSFGDRTSYQIDPANGREAMREIELDIEEGADIVMVKPALLYLDVIKEARMRFGVPIAAYHVSGEYAMIKAAGRLGWLDDLWVEIEALTAMRRAGADIIITYSALEVAEVLGGRRR
ncbi:Delta-aminolevulinic acid dehydratase [Candidatus Calditenuaceae archaeon HR02]|nr:Delta-aminolevulinic acid dehydratase [Candidatus Calditenuaceae archaeon HR02]